MRGRVIDVYDIDRIRITKTEQDSTALRSAAVRERNKSRSSGIIAIPPISLDYYIADMGEDVTDEFITVAPGSEPQEPQATLSGREVSQKPTDTRTVFVVHGRNERAREAMFVFLRAIGLHPLEWSEAIRATGNPIPYVGEILETAFATAQAVVVLFTPDDEARLRDAFRATGDPPHETELTGQARPNVLFEAGMAMGRSQERTVLVELGSLRPFSDIAGRHTIRIDNTSQRRQELAQRLEAAGCAVNLDGIDWHSAGDFDAAIQTVQ